MKQELKRAHWASIIEQQKHSQLTIKQFCHSGKADKCIHFEFEMMFCMGRSALLKKRA